MTSERRGRRWPVTITQPSVLMHASTKEGWANVVAFRFLSAAMLHSMTHPDCDPCHLREYLERRFRHKMPEQEILENLARKQIGQSYEQGELKRINLAIRTHNLLSDAGFLSNNTRL